MRTINRCSKALPVLEILFPQCSLCLPCSLPTQTTLITVYIESLFCYSYFLLQAVLEVIKYLVMLYIISM